MPSNVVASPVLWLCAALALALAAPRIPASAVVGPPLPPPSGGGGGSVCRRWCGDVHIPYPFGIGPDVCSLPGFHLHCNDTGNGVLKLFYSEVEVVNISLLQGQMRVLNHISYSCYTAAGSKEEDHWSFHLSEHYSFSGTSNKFTAIGCRTLAYISGAANSNGGGDDDVDTYQTGCVALCGHDNLRRLSNGSCSGMGCCQTSIPPDLRHYDVSFDDRVNTSEFNGTNPCSYAVLLESSSFAFSTAYLTPNEFNKSNHGQVPVLLDWVVGNETCRVARTKPGYACVSSNSQCVDAASGFGYLCNCTEGYQGNPYLNDSHGCKDINECMDHRKYPCHGKCINKPGTYHCYCPVGTQGNASIEECQKQPSPFGLGARLAIVSARKLRGQRGPIWGGLGQSRDRWIRRDGGAWALGGCPGGGDMRQAGSGTLARGGASCWWVLPQRGSPGRAVAVARREGETNDGGRGREGRERDKRPLWQRPLVFGLLTMTIPLPRDSARPRTRIWGRVVGTVLRPPMMTVPEVLSMSSGSGITIPLSIVGMGGIVNGGGPIVYVLIVGGSLP
uniref:EGF-like domain-containing protein n=1 Tax=Saccharum hybrid cultivar R570 TaxID=131158 RepID=A0A059Q1R0_9POAL|nr:hypothetical protein SHCRBa_201_F17_F_310 [Saccharum hybrid cultivar R570]